MTILIILSLWNSVGCNRQVECWVPDGKYKEPWQFRAVRQYCDRRCSHLRAVLHCKYWHQSAKRATKWAAGWGHAGKKRPRIDNQPHQYSGACGTILSPAAMAKIMQLYKSGKLLDCVLGGRIFKWLVCFFLGSRFAAINVPHSIWALRPCLLQLKRCQFIV